MKNLFKVAAVALCMVFMGNFAKAQTKIGYIAVDQIVPLMPEYKTFQITMEAYQKTFVDKFNSLQTELQNKSKDYEAKQATMNDATKTAAVGDINDLQKRLQDYQTTASQQIEAKGQEQMKPITDKVKLAITTVAKEKGYTYVFNTSSTDIIVAPDADNLLAAVKLKLNLK
jgi:outer membrane protein